MVATIADVELVSVVGIPDLAKVDVCVEDRLLSLLSSLVWSLPSSRLARLRRLAASSTCNDSVKDILTMSSWGRRLGAGSRLL